MEHWHICDGCGKQVKVVFTDGKVAICHECTRADHQQDRIRHLEAEIERLRTAAEVACKHWVSVSNMQDAAMAALCDHMGIDYEKDA